MEDLSALVSLAFDGDHKGRPAFVVVTDKVARVTPMNPPYDTEEYIESFVEDLEKAR